MNEKLLEEKLRKEIKKMGGLALKFVPLYFVGMPDRIILMPDARVYWVEAKSTGEKLRPIQETRKRT